MGWVAGALLSATGSVASNLGVNIQKYSFLRNASRDKSQQVRYTKQPMWCFGLFLVAFGSIGDFAALSMVAQSIVAPIGSITLVANVFFAHYFLHESLSWRELVGTLLIIVGSVVSVVFGDHGSATYTIHDLIRFYYNPTFIVYALLASTMCMGMYLFCRHVTPMKIRLSDAITRYEDSDAVNDNAGMEWEESIIGRLESEYRQWQKWHPFCLCALSGICGAQSVMFGKSVAELLATTFAGHIQIFSPLFWLFLVCMLVCVVSQLHFLAVALNFFDALYVVPVFQCFFISFSTVGGAAYFGEFSSFSAVQTLLFPLGLLMTLGGVLVLSTRKMGQRKVVDASAAANIDESQMIDLESELQIHPATHSPATQSRHLATLAQGHEAKGGRLHSQDSMSQSDAVTMADSARREILTKLQSATANRQHQSQQQQHTTIRITSEDEDEKSEQQQQQQQKDSEKRSTASSSSPPATAAERDLLDLNAIPAALTQQQTDADKQASHAGEGGEDEKQTVASSPLPATTAAASAAGRQVTFAASTTPGGTSSSAAGRRGSTASATGTPVRSSGAPTLTRQGSHRATPSRSGRNSPIQLDENGVPRSTTSGALPPTAFFLGSTFLSPTSALQPGVDQPVSYVSLPAGDSLFNPLEDRAEKLKRYTSMSHHFDGLIASVPFVSAAAHFYGMRNDGVAAEEAEARQRRDAERRAQQAAADAQQAAAAATAAAAAATQAQQARDAQDSEHHSVNITLPVAEPVHSAEVSNSNFLAAIRRSSVIAAIDAKFNQHKNKDKIDNQSSNQMQQQQQQQQQSALISPTEDDQAQAGDGASTVRAARDLDASSSQTLPVAQALSKDRSEAASERDAKSPDNQESAATKATSQDLDLLALPINTQNLDPDEDEPVSGQLQSGSLSSRSELSPQYRRAAQGDALIDLASLMDENSPAPVSQGQNLADYQRVQQQQQQEESEEDE